MTKNKLRTICLFIAGLLWACMAQARESVNSTGGDAKGTGGTVAYSVGQVVYTSHSGTFGSIAQGVQQSYEIIITGVNETLPDISLSVFPNPTTEQLILQISDYNSHKLSYQLFNMQGNMLNNGQIAAPQTEINMNSLPSATYFVDVVNQENKKIQSFKIIKN